MAVIINGDTSEFRASDFATLADLIARIEQGEDAGERRVVVGGELDGSSLSSEALQESETQLLSGIQSVSLECRSVRAVACSVLEQGADYTTQVVQTIDKIAEHYRNSRSDLANDLLANMTDALAVLTGITESVLGVLGDRVEVLGRLQGELSPWLEEMIEAQTENDPIRLADTLEYEIRPRVESWGTAMRALVAEFKSSEEGVSI